MSTPYMALYKNLLPKFKDYEIPLMTTDEIKDLLKDYILPATVRFHVCEKDLSRNDKLEEFNSDLSDSEIEILSNYLLLEYIDSNYIRTPTLLKPQMLSTDFHALHLDTQLARLLEMHDKYRKENETLLSRYSWLNKDSISRFKNKI